MKELSKKLALVLIEYDKLPRSIQRSIEYNRENEHSYRMKGDLKLLKVGEKYLYVNPSLFAKSLLTSIYGTRIDRTNEDSFDTLLCNFFTMFNIARRNSISEDKISEYISGMEFYAENNSIENLWHTLNLAKQCIENSYYPNFNSLLSFYALVELLVLKDIKPYKRPKGNTIVKECGRKLPYFYKKIDTFDFPAKCYINKNISETEIFENLTQLRHKVIHGVFGEAQMKLECLFPFVNSKNTYMGNTEDAESSAFQDQIQNLNDLIRSELGQILYEWMKSPSQLSIIKNNINFTY